MIKHTIIIIAGIILLTLSILSYSTEPAVAAVGCTLNNPDRDIRNLFPDSTGYKTHFKTIRKLGGNTMMAEIEKRLGDKLEEQYENMDVDHVYYQVFKGKETIGYVFGINQTGEYGLLQLILATDTSGKVINFYYQRFRSPNASAFKDKKFTGQFIERTLADFYAHSAYNGTDKDPLAGVKDPTGSNDPDFPHTMRGLKLNLILLDTFWLKNKYDSYWVK